MKFLKDIFAGRRWMLLALLLAAATALAVTPQETVDRFSQAPGLPHGSMAVLVSDLATGKVLGSYNADTPLTPASIMKCVTLASLSEAMDMEQPLFTPVMTDGKIGSDGILHGNLIIEGRGDPSLNSTVWPQTEDFISEITTALRDAGVNEIEGDIFVDDSYFAGDPIPPSWASGDLPHAYGTGSHAFNYSNNASGKSAVRDPSAAFRADLKRRLAGAGISVTGTPLPKGRNRTALTRHRSAELKEIMRSCMMRSDNLFAETSLRLFGKNKGGDGSTSDAASREHDFWKGKRVDLSDVRIIDGSGLSRSNRVTARFMESVLRRKSDDVEYVSFFPLAGQEGTLKKFLADTPLDSYIAMKTGSMNGIQCYAGYKLDDDFAPTHVVVVIVNDFRCSRQQVRAAVERMLLDIFSDPDIKNQKYRTPQKNLIPHADRQ